MTLAHRLNLARNTFLAFARRNPCKAGKAASLADAIEEAIDEIAEQKKQINFLENAMRSSEELAKALLADDATKTQGLVDANTKIADLTAQRDAALADTLTPETKAAIDAVVPEVPAA
jgi:chromosome segregation ATPase